MGQARDAAALAGPGCTEWSGLLHLVDAHIVNQHDLRKDRRFVEGAWPFTTNGHVQHQVERTLERPGCLLGRSAFLTSKYRWLSRYHPGCSQVATPLHRGGSHPSALAPWATHTCHLSRPPRNGQEMNRCTMDYAWFPADIYHHIDLAARRPSHLINVGTEQPEGWPDTLPERNLDACFYQSIGERKVLPRDQSGEVKRHGPYQQVRWLESVFATAAAVIARQLLPSSAAFAV